MITDLRENRITSLKPVLTGAGPGTEAAQADPATLRIALQLRAARPRPDAPLTVVLIPSTRGHNVQGMGHKLALAFRQLGEGPVMDIRFGGTPAAGSREFSLSLGDETADPLAAVAPESGEVRANSLVSARVATCQKSSLPLAERIALFLNQAQLAFRTIVIEGDALDESLETMMVAPLCDAAVLAVAGGVATRTEVRQTQQELLRCGASIKGFIYDETPRIGTVCEGVSPS